MKKLRRLIVGFIVIILFLILSSIYHSFIQAANDPIQTNELPTIQEVRPIPTGEQTFGVQGLSKDMGVSGVINPYDPSYGSSQLLRLNIFEPNGIDHIEAFVTTDKRCSHFSLSLVSGIPTNGSWEGSWTVRDTYFYTYLMSIRIFNIIGQKYDIDLTLR